MPITTITDISRLVQAGFDDWSQYGNVRVVESPDAALLLFSYSDKAQYEGRWNYFEQVSRGLILDRAGNVVARPFDKFFNWGEGGRTSTAALVSVTEKLDGSLGILYPHAGAWHIATKGAFSSDQAQWATDWLRRQIDPALLARFAAYTLLFEIVYPANRIVVDYGDRAGLTLLAARALADGDYMPRADLVALADLLGVPVVRQLPLASLAAISEALAQLTGTDGEGVVAEFADGQRFKFKSAAYLALHRLISGISFSFVLSAVADGRFDDLFRGVPDEFLVDVRRYLAEIEATTAQIEGEVARLMGLAPKESRKEFALWVRANCPEYAPYLFRALDGGEVRPMIYQHAFKGTRN